MKLTINNIGQFFDLKRSNPNSLKPGMLYMFEYNADNIHDQRPLIWVLEVKSDRIWGLNLHYDLKILADILKFKESEIKGSTLKEKQKIQDEKLRQDKLKGKDLSEKNPNVVDSKIKNDETTAKLPSDILENFSNYSIGNNSKILRNYLNRNIRNSYKLSFKTPK